MKKYYDIYVFVRNIWIKSNDSGLLALYHEYPRSYRANYDNINSLRPHDTYMRR